MRISVMLKLTNVICLIFVVLVPNSCDAVLKDYRSLQKNVTRLLDSLLDKNRYDKRIRPDFGGPPVTITVNMHIKSMGPVSETEEFYAMDCYFRQTWIDRRLTYSFPGLEEFSLSWLFLDRVWKPDTFFMNGKKSHLHRITVPNKFLRLRDDGFLTYSMRLTIVATCRMHLRKFPLDSQKCPLFIASYGYRKNDVLYRWQVNDSVLEDDVELAQYDLVNITTDNALTVLRGVDEYSMIKVSFMMKRHTGYFMLQVFSPCCLIVCCSWVSFWINPSDVPGRVTLGVTTVLSMTTMGFGGRAQMPKVSYATALDWFVILCFSFVFAVMIEYACINFIDKVTMDIRRLLVERGVRKGSQPKAPAEAVEASTEEHADAQPSEPVVPTLVVDLAPTPTKADEELAPIYAEVADVVPHSNVSVQAPIPTTQPGEDLHWKRFGLASQSDRTYGVLSSLKTPTLPNLPARNFPLGKDGAGVLSAALVVAVTRKDVGKGRNTVGGMDTPPSQVEGDTPPVQVDTPPVGRRIGQILDDHRKDSVGSSPSSPLESRGIDRVRPGNLRRDSENFSLETDSPRSRRDTLIVPDSLGMSRGDDVLEMCDDDDGPSDGMEGLQAHIRGSMLELSEALGSITSSTRRSFKRCLKAPYRMWAESKFLPREEDVTKQIMSDEEPNKFSKIDIEARKYFPLAFITLLTTYWVLYLHYITDEFPAKTHRDLLTNRRQ